jgi:hypothetical protein
MTNNNGLANGHSEQTPESLQTLAEYLEQSLDKSTSIVMMRHTADICTMYLGDPAGPREELRQVGAIAISLANDILESTSSGANQMPIGGEIYRFVRSFTQIGDTPAVVFSAD